MTWPMPVEGDFVGAMAAVRGKRLAEEELNENVLVLLCHDLTNEIVRLDPIQMAMEDGKTVAQFKVGDSRCVLQNDQIRCTPVGK